MCDISEPALHSFNIYVSEEKLMIMEIHRLTSPQPAAIADLTLSRQMFAI